MDYFYFIQFAFCIKAPLKRKIYSLGDLLSGFTSVFMIECVWLACRSGPFGFSTPHSSHFMVQLAEMQDQWRDLKVHKKMRVINDTLCLLWLPNFELYRGPSVPPASWSACYNK